MQVSASSTLGGAAPLPFAADPDAAGQQDAQEQDSAAGNGNGSSSLKDLLPDSALSPNIALQLQAKPQQQTTQQTAPANSVQTDSARASDQRFYDTKIADASNPVSAIGYTYLRALNNAGHDIADGIKGLYTLATDKNAQQQLASNLGQAIEHPVDTAASLYNAGKNYVNNTSTGEKAEDALRFVAGGFATAGAGKVTVIAGKAVGGSVMGAGRTLAPVAARMSETYLSRIGAMAYAVEPGIPAAEAKGVETAAAGAVEIAAKDKTMATVESTTENGARIFTSPDPIVGTTATTIDRALFGAVKDINVPITNSSLGLKSDADILLRNGDVIEVKSGGGKGATTQIINQTKIIGDSGEVIAFGPDLKPSVIKGIQDSGVKVFTNLNDLIAYIKTKGL